MFVIVDCPQLDVDSCSTMVINFLLLASICEKKFNKTGNGNKETGKQFSRKFLKIEEVKKCKCYLW